MRCFLFHIFLMGILPTFSPSAISSQEPMPLIISSGEAEYDGKDISLTGNVDVQYGLGRARGQRAVFSPSSTASQPKPCYFKIESEVVIDLEKGGQLTCQQAEVDYLALKGTFLGNENSPDVLYKGPRQNEKGELLPPLVVRGRKTLATLARESTSEEGNSKPYIERLEILGDVRAFYNDEHLLFADSALFTSGPSGKAGQLFLNGECALSNKQGDIIKTKTLEVDLTAGQLLGQEATGWLSLGEERVQKAEFSSQQLICNIHDRSLTLKGSVKICIEGLGELTTDNELKLLQDSEGHRTLRYIYAPQATTLSGLDKERGIHKLICQGPIDLDLTHKQLIFQKTQNTTDLEEAQVFIEDSLGELYADRVQLDYEHVDRKAVPKKLALQGHVKILNRFDGRPSSSGPVLQYALADLVEYFPEVQEMTLSGQEGNRALFYDKVNSVQMSAPAFKIERPRPNKKGSIKGMGEVRFNFIQKELDQFRQHFQFKTTSSK